MDIESLDLSKPIRFVKKYTHVSENGIHKVYPSSIEGLFIVEYKWNGHFTLVGLYKEQDLENYDDND